MNQTTAELFTPITMGAIACKNRIVMAPMTRSRADDDGLPNQLHVQYYGARAGAGLIITEGVQPSADGKGYARTPGLHTEQQTKAWQQVVERVHAAGTPIVAQLMHVGRIASRHNKAPGTRTVAPSAIAANVNMFTDVAGMQPCELPEALSASGIQEVIADFTAAARLARTADFDGVEVHCTSGYLPMQFLAENANHRTDQYGGSALNRARFIVELMEALCAAIGADRVGLRICPGNPFNDTADPDPRQTHAVLLDALAPLRYGWLHVIRSPDRTLDAFALARTHYSGPVIVNDGFDPQSAAAAIRSGIGDAVSFGRHFIANPDLAERIHAQAPLAGFDRGTLYTPGATGYTDYPNWSGGKAQS
jgi:N-ethylmaleimide reductase